MIIHLFNSSSISGPERLVLPALADYPDSFMVINLVEERIGRLLESDPLEEYCRSLNLPYRGIRVKRRWDPAAVAELAHLLSDLHPNLVHAHAIKASAYLIHAGRTKPHRYPIVSTHHGVHGLPDWTTRFYEWLYRKLYLPSYDRVLAVSSADYDFLLRSGIKKDRLRLHRNGIDGPLVNFEDRPAAARKARAQWLPKNAERNSLFLFGVVARLSREKDHDRLLRILSELNRRPCERDWKCLIFGEGALGMELRQTANRLGLGQRVIWMGYQESVGDSLAGLNLLLSFSKAEGLPLNLIEAGWAGTPVMCTKVGGVADLIPDERYGNGVRLEESGGGFQQSACADSLRKRERKNFVNRPFDSKNESVRNLIRRRGSID